MNYNSPEKERSNNILFVLFLFLLICLSSGYFNWGWIGVFVVILLPGILFSGVIYGFISKNPLKAFFVGSLPFAMVFGISDLVNLKSLTSGTLNEHLLSNLPAIGMVFVYLILWGLVAFFAARKREDNEKNRRHYIALSVFVILSVFLYSSFVLYTFAPDFTIILPFNPFIGLALTFGGLPGYFMAQRRENRGWIFIILSILIVLTLMLCIVLAISFAMP